MNQMMMTNKLVKAFVAAALAACVALAGCASGAQSQATDEQEANRAYMSQVNEAMTKLDTELDAFVDAVSRGDVVNMRTQADNAYASLDKLAGIEAPEALTDIKKDYVDGTAKLREALDAYIDLYSEAAKAGSDYDWSAYDDKVKEVQALYDEGISLLEKGDKLAAEAK